MSPAVPVPAFRPPSIVTLPPFPLASPAPPLSARTPPAKLASLAPPAIVSAGVAPDVHALSEMDCAVLPVLLPRVMLPSTFSALVEYVVPSPMYTWSDDVSRYSPWLAVSLPLIQPPPILRSLPFRSMSALALRVLNVGLAHLTPLAALVSAVRTKSSAPTTRAAGSVAPPVDVPTSSEPFCSTDNACTAPVPLPINTPPSVSVEAPVPPAATGRSPV